MFGVAVPIGCGVGYGNARLVPAPKIMAASVLMVVFGAVLLAGTHDFGRDPRFWYDLLESVRARDESPAVDDHGFGGAGIVGRASAVFIHGNHLGVRSSVAGA